MKKIFVTILFLTISTISFSQTFESFPLKDGKVVYEAVSDINGKSKDQLFKAAKKWFVDTFKNSNSVIKSEDKDAGQIIGKGNFTGKEKVGFMTYFDMRYDFSIQVDIKDSKYRVRLYDITLINETTPNSIESKSGIDRRGQAADIEQYNDRLIKSHNKAMHENASVLDLKFKSLIVSLSDSMKSNDDF